MRIGLALGSGGARGLSQIGVLAWLEEMGIRVSTVTGCSFGALIGGLYALGNSPQSLKAAALGIKRLKLLLSLRPYLSVRGVVGEGRIFEVLREFFDGYSFENLSLPFACVAADLDTGEEVVFREGDLVSGIGASMSMPGIFPPVRLKGRNLVDGALVNPVPIDLALELGAGRVIGVNVSKPVYVKRVQAENRQPQGRKRLQSWLFSNLERMPGVVSEYLDKQFPERQAGTKAARERSAYSAIMDSITVFSTRILHLKSLTAGPHLLIEPQVGAFRSFDFDQAAALIEAGYRAMSEREQEILAFCGAGS